jgi:hypothetical protein
MDWTCNTLWTDQLPANTYRSVDLKVGQTKVEDATFSTSLWRYDIEK